MIIDSEQNYKEIAREAILYGPMTVRSFLQSFTSIDVQRCHTIRPIADEYNRIAESMDIPVIKEKHTGCLLLPYEFLRNNFWTVTTTIADRLFDKLYPTKPNVLDSID